MVDLSFFEKNRTNIVFLLITLAVVLLLLYMVWPWRYALLLALWAAYVLWWPTGWLTKVYPSSRHRGAYRSMVVVLLLLSFALLNVTVILVREIAQIAAGQRAQTQRLAEGSPTHSTSPTPGLRMQGPSPHLSQALRPGEASLLQRSLTPQAALYGMFLSISPCCCSSSSSSFSSYWPSCERRCHRQRFQEHRTTEISVDCQSVPRPSQPDLLQFLRDILRCSRHLRHTRRCYLRINWRAVFRHVRDLHHVCRSHSFHRTRPYLRPSRDLAHDSRANGSRPYRAYR